VPVLSVNGTLDGLAATIRWIKAGVVGVRAGTAVCTFQLVKMLRVMKGRIRRSCRLGRIFLSRVSRVIIVLRCGTDDEYKT
jgi:hypothetical protein